MGIQEASCMGITEKLIPDWNTVRMLRAEFVMSVSKACAVFSSLLLLWVAWTSRDNMSIAVSVRGRCECVNKVDRVHLKRIADIMVLQKNPLCHETQIILTLEQDRAACLNPDSEQGQRLQECWTSHNKNTAKTKGCIRKKTTVQ
ncbi:hypothetical protein SKAU_G00179190 [Synaphobranchus kaupii]|uniref:Chemokine interleukin-8-like domain-containing protein n=1 Tax=Synaphobranchus kaupii TaxID=118154 RepID=A0A9Q1IZC7_SYNKA|nr:hypothetical protein SKAU_G00179190 [Synaphobranchus kaupii]